MSTLTAAAIALLAASRASVCGASGSGFGDIDRGGRGSGWRCEAIPPDKFENGFRPNLFLTSQNVGFRHGDNVVATFVDGSMPMTGIEEARDMRLWARDTLGGKYDLHSAGCAVRFAPAAGRGEPFPALPEARSSHHVAVLGDTPCAAGPPAAGGSPMKAATTQRGTPRCVRSTCVRPSAGDSRMHSLSIAGRLRSSRTRAGSGFPEG